MTDFRTSNGASRTSNEYQRRKMLCAWCKSEMVGVSSRRKFCSGNCRNRNRYAKRPEYYKAKVRKAREERRARTGLTYYRPRLIERLILRDKLKSVPCSDCLNTFDPVCMDFDHRPGENKCGVLGTMFASPSIPIDELIKEVEKCDVVCSNCHRLRTKKRGGWHGFK